MTEPVLLTGDEPGADAELRDILNERVTLVNASQALVDLAMSLAPGPDFDDPVAMAALQVWAASAPAEGEWYPVFYGALVDPSVVYADHGGTRPRHAELDRVGVGRGHRVALRRVRGGGI
jgi:hypothetical protein